MRFRLLSYVAAMLLLAGVLGVNLTPLTYPDDLMISSVSENASWGTTVDRYGWPFVCASFHTPNLLFGWLEWHWLALASDIFIGLAIPIAGLLASEFVLWRYAPGSTVERRAFKRPGRCGAANCISRRASVPGGRRSPAS